MHITFKIGNYFQLISYEYKGQAGKQLQLKNCMCE